MVWQREDKIAYEDFLEKHKAILVFFMFLFVCLSIRLFYLQIIKGSKYRDISEQQSVHNTYERAPRGIIYSADNLPLAENKFTYVVLYHPYERHLKPSEQIIQELNKILGREIKPTVDKNWRYGRVIKLADNLSMEEMFKLQEKKLSLKGVAVAKESSRVYCSPEVISHIIGYTGEVRSDEIEDLAEHGYKMGDYIGRGGIEQTYDQYLQGKDGGWQIEVNARGYQVKAFKYLNAFT